MTLGFNNRISWGLIVISNVAVFAGAIYFRLPFFLSRTNRQRFLISAVIAVPTVFLTYYCVVALLTAALDFGSTSDKRTESVTLPSGEVLVNHTFREGPSLGGSGERMNKLFLNNPAKGTSELVGDLNYEGEPNTPSLLAESPHPQEFIYGDEKILVIGSYLCQRIKFGNLPYPKAPDGGRQMVYDNANEILQHDPRFLGGFRMEELTIAEHYRDYGVGTKDLASGKLLSATKSDGNWTYLFMHGTNAVGAAGLIADEKAGKALKANGLYQTDFSNETLAAIRMAEQLPQVKKQDYEIRRLDSPPILFVAIWLHGKSDDIIIPVGATFGRWNALQPYSESQMIKLLKPEAKKKLKEPPGMFD